MEAVVAMPSTEILPECVPPVHAEAKRPRLCMRAGCDWGVVNTLPKVLGLFDKPRVQTLMPVAGMGPVKAARALGTSFASETDQLAWVARARHKFVLLQLKTILATLT